MVGIIAEEEDEPDGRELHSLNPDSKHIRELYPIYLERRPPR